MTRMHSLFSYVRGILYLSMSRIEQWSEMGEVWQLTRIYWRQLNDRQVGIIPSVARQSGATKSDKIAYTTVAAPNND